MKPYVCIHGHFYQPPRENPWLDEVEIQDSAYPYHDWNARITAECYATNAASRILDDAGYITSIVSNYGRISFNFGATLFTWMERNAPDVYAAILAADRESRERFGGHGVAIAQVYNHVIMPLANERDKRTQVVWGMRDFEARFGRKPEGMWLAETAADTASLEALAEQGIAFTILAPRQAKRVKLTPDADWQDVDEGSVDTTRPYFVNLPSGRKISVFFYDGPLSRAVAFERLLTNGHEFADRLVGGAGEWDDDKPRLVHIATDGETYGHHHRFGDMGLAFALHDIEANDRAQITVYGEYLALHPPEAEAEIVENSSWSCAHGIERWRSGCGCNTGGHGDWNQAWRGPLRAALDWLRDSLAPRFETETALLLKDAWAARDDYVSLILDRSEEARDAFFNRHALKRLDLKSRRRALKLLEMQRQTQLMYASCAWFYDEVSGIETVQVMSHAGRALQLAQELFSARLEQEFLERLAEAKSNIPEQQDGAAAYKRFVLPARVDLERVAAHYAVASLFHDYEDETRVGAYRVQRETHETLVAGRTKLAFGRLQSISEATGESEPYYFAAIDLGDQNVAGGIKRSDNIHGYELLVEAAKSIFLKGDLTGTLRLIDDQLGIGLSLRSLFRDEQRRVLEQVIDPVNKQAEAAYTQLYNEHISLLRFLESVSYTRPGFIRLAADVALDVALRGALAQDDVDPGRVHTLIEEARLAGVELDADTLSRVFQQTLERLAQAFSDSFEHEDLARLVKAASVLAELPFNVDLWRPQNLFYASVSSILAREEGELPGDGRADLTALADALRVRLPVG